VGRTHELRRVTSTWTETGVTWNNQPTVTGGPNVTTVVPATAQCVSVDAATEVQAWLSGVTNYGWRINDLDEANAAPAPYATREEPTASLRPRLDVIYIP